MFRISEFITAFELALENINYKYLEPMNKSGGWAEIFYVYSKEDKEVRVAKVYKEPLGRITEDIYKSDAKKLMDINHKNVVKIIENGIILYDNKKYFFLILEYIRGKNFDEIDPRLFLEISYKKRLNFLIQTLDGINKFRENFELHRDLHPGNIMLSDVDENNVRTIKIIDPGSSRYYYEPEDEDIDLFSLKEGIINLFLQSEELKDLNEFISLKDLNFQDFRKLIDDVYNQVIKEIYMTFQDDSTEFLITLKDQTIYSEEEINEKKDKIKSEYLYIPNNETDNSLAIKESIKESKELKNLRESIEKSEVFKVIKDFAEKIPFPKIKSIPEEDWQVYYECVELYSKKYGEYLSKLNEFNQKMRKYCNIGFNLHNNANFTLYDITIYISIPEGLDIQTEPLDDPPSEPKPPPKFNESKLLFNEFNYDFGKEIRKYREELKTSGFSSIFSSIMPEIDIPTLIKSPFKILDDGRLRVKIDNLTQSHYYKIPIYGFLIKDDEENQRIKINWVIYIGTPSQTLQGELWVVIRK